MSKFNKDFVPNTMSPFYNDWVFETREQLMEWVQTTARNLGYVIVTQRTKKTVLGFVKKVYLICDRGGEYKSASHSTTHSGTKKCGCPFQLIAKYNHDPTCSGWKINVICDKHNHDPATFLEGHAFAKRLSKKEFEMVEDMTTKNMLPRDILTQLKKNDDQNVSTSQTVYDARQKIRKAERVGQTPMQSMVKSLHAGDYVYHIRQEPDSNHVHDLFFINPISMKMWRAFPHVLILDPTYKTNRYHLPFLQIVGLTSTNKTFCIAFAFIRNEKTDNFKWVLHCLRQTLDGYMLPRVIVTDRDLALMEACRYVFPEASRLLCRYHIYENIRKHCRPSFSSKTDWDKFTSWWNRVVNSPTTDEYDQNRTRLRSKLIDKQNVFTYLDANWLQKYKEMFVSAWIDQHLNFGQRTTNRVESQHFVLKKHLDNEKSHLDKFVGIIDDIVRIQYTEIKATFGESMNKIKHIHRNITFSLLLTKVSIEALDLLTGEMKRVKSIKQKEQSCGCQIRTSCGLPCACEVSEYIDAGVSIPLHSINVFWKKLDFEVALLNQDEPNEPDDPDTNLRKQVHAFEEAYNKEKRAVVKKSWLQKLKGIWDPSSTSYDEPEVQTKTRGRPGTKSKQQQKPDLATTKPPLQRSYSHKPQRHSSYAPSGERDYFQERTRHSSFRYSQDQEQPTPSSLRDYDDSPGYNSAYVNYQTPGEPSPFMNQDTFGYPEPATQGLYGNYDDYPGYNSAYVNYQVPTEPSQFVNQDVAEQSYFSNPSTAPTYDFFGLNENTAEQPYFTNTSGATEYDFLGLSQHNVTYQKSQDYHNYIDQIPTIFHPYVEDIKNVLGDGNCGFRATAAALGYGEDQWLLIRRLLIDEMVQFETHYRNAFNDEYNGVFQSLEWSGAGFAPQKYWMIMPETAFLIANKFNVIFHFISKEGNNSSILFPLWRGPDQFPDKKIITIALVNSNHYVTVEMQGEFPMGFTHNLWRLRRERDAAQWQNLFKSRQKLYKDWVAKPAEYEVID